MNAQVLQAKNDNNCSMANAFHLADGPRRTLRDFMAITKLKKVDARNLDLMISNHQGFSVKELEAVCHKRLKQYILAMFNMR